MCGQAFLSGISAHQGCPAFNTQHHESMAAAFGAGIQAAGTAVEAMVAIVGRAFRLSDLRLIEIWCVGSCGARCRALACRLYPRSAKVQDHRIFGGRRSFSRLQCRQQDPCHLRYRLKIMRRKETCPLGRYR